MYIEYCYCIIVNTPIRYKFRMEKRVWRMRRVMQRTLMSSRALACFLSWSNAQERKHLKQRAGKGGGKAKAAGKALPKAKAAAAKSHPRALPTSAPQTKPNKAQGKIEENLSTEKIVIGNASGSGTKRAAAAAGLESAERTVTRAKPNVKSDGLMTGLENLSEADKATIQHFFWPCHCRAAPCRGCLQVIHDWSLFKDIISAQWVEGEKEVSGAQEDLFYRRDGIHCGDGEAGKSGQRCIASSQVLLGCELHSRLWLYVLLAQLVTKLNTKY